MPTESSPLVGSASSRPPLRVIASLLGLVAPAMLGNMLEFYEFGVYVEVTPQLTANFFDDYGDFGHSFGVWFGFAVSFIVRPFGGALFGFIADKFGRRISIILSVAGMLTCTAGIGLLPTTGCCGAAAGVAGLVLLLLLKLCQGLFVGGEIVATMIFAVESAGPAHAATAAGLTLATASVGLIMAQLVVGVVETLTSDEQMLAWGWRVPFLLALPWGTAAVVLVARQHESAEFAEHKADAEQTPKGAVAAGKPDPHAATTDADADAGASPFAVLRRSHKRALGFAVLTTVVHAGVFWGSVLFPKDFLLTAEVRSERVAMWSTATGMVVAVVNRGHPRCHALPVSPASTRTHDCAASVAAHPRTRLPPARVSRPPGGLSGARRRRRRRRPSALRHMLRRRLRRGRVAALVLARAAGRAVGVVRGDGDVWRARRRRLLRRGAHGAPPHAQLEARSATARTVGSPVDAPTRTSALPARPPRAYLPCVYLTRPPLRVEQLGLFPTGVRASGFGMSWNIAQALGAGVAPFVAKGVWEALEDEADANPAASEGRWCAARPPSSHTGALLQISDLQLSLTVRADLAPVQRCCAGGGCTTRCRRCGRPSARSPRSSGSWRCGARASRAA